MRALLFDEVDHLRHLIELFRAYIRAMGEAEVNLENVRYQLYVHPLQFASKALIRAQLAFCISRRHPLTKAYFLFKFSSVNGLPFWSTKSKFPPTFGLPTPFVA